MAIPWTWFAGIWVRSFSGDGLDANSDKLWNMFYYLSCRNPCRLFIYDNFFGSLGLQLPVSAFVTNERSWNAMVAGLQSRVWSGPKLDCRILHTFFWRTLSSPLRTVREGGGVNFDNTRRCPRQKKKPRIARWWRYHARQTENVSIHNIVSGDFMHWTMFFVPTPCNTSHLV